MMKFILFAIFTIGAVAAMSPPYQQLCGNGGYTGQFPCGEITDNGPCNAVSPFNCGNTNPVRPDPIPTEVAHVINETFVPAEENENRYCPSGTVPEGDSCVDRLTPNCPPNYVWTDDRCAATQTSCPLDYEYIGGTCVLRKICPEHYILQNGRCILPTPVCTPGWTWNGVNCETKEIYCEQGSVRKGNQCVTTSFTCPPGYIENREGCSKPPIQCASGYVLSQSGFCVYKTQKCPYGSTMYNGRCRTVSITCPEGTYRSGDKCYRYVTERPRPSRDVSYCPEGFNLMNNLCYKCSTPVANPIPCYQNYQCQQPQVENRPCMTTLPLHRTQYY